MPDGGAGGVRIGVAFDDVTLEAAPEWSYLTATDNLVASYQIDRGRAFEFDKTDTGTATVTIIDRGHVLDPTNSTGPHYNQLEPLRQIQIELLNPVTGNWLSRYRGFIEDFDYGIDAETRMGRLTINCVDLFAILTAIEMQPVARVGHPTLAAFGHDLPSQQANGNIYFQNDRANDRIAGVLGNAGVPVDFYVVFELNVNVLPSTYSPSENVLQVIQDAADAEFPTVANVYCDRFGRLCVHGRMARFDPEDTAADAGTDTWEFNQWHAGDAQAVADHVLDGSPDAFVQIRELAFNRGLSKVLNSALCTQNGMTDTQIAGQYVQDATSIGAYGWRSWSAENLFVDTGILTGFDGPTECLAFAQWIVDNFKVPRNRITLLGFRTMAVDWPGAEKTWNMLGHVDIGDMIDVTETNEAGGGFDAEPFFIEGIHESVEPLNPDMADVTLTLDVSPVAYFPPDSPLRGPH